jgi:hypothetical protein
MDNVVRLPRDWLGPVEDLVPFGPAADSTPDARQPDAGDASPMAPVPSAQSFWTQDAASLHAALDAGPARAPDIDVPARDAESIPVLGPTPRGAFSRPGVRHWRGLLTSIAALLALAAVLLMKSAATGINPATGRLDARVSPPAEAQSQSASHLAHGLAAQAARASADRAATAPRGHRAAAATRPRRHPRGRHPATAATTYVSTRAARSSVVTGSSYHPATASATPAATYVTQPQAGSESASTAASTSSSTASTSSSAPGPTGPGAPFGPGHTG